MQQARRADKADRESGSDKRKPAADDRAGGEVVTIKRRAASEGGDAAGAGTPPAAMPRFLLKCLSGPNLGAEATLPDGEFTVGSSDECDVVLADQAVAAKHLRARAGDDGITLLALPAAVLDEAGATLKEGAVVPLFSLLLIGTTYIQIGPRGQTWPTAKRPGTIPAAAPPAEAPAETPVAPPRELVATAPAHAAPPRRGGRSLVVAAGAVLGAILLAVAGYWLLSGHPGEAPAAAAVAPPSMQEKAGSVVAALGLDAEVAVVTAADGRLLLAGYVRTGEQRRKLMAALRTAGVEAKLEIWSEDVLIAAAKDALAAAGFKLDATLAGPGRLRLQGYVATDKGLSGALDEIRQDMVGIQSIDNRVLTPATVVPALQRILDGHGLADQLTLVPVAAGVEVSGTLAKDDMDRWRQSAEEFAATYGNGPRIDAAVTPRMAEASLPLRSIVVGPTSFVTLTDGISYRVGDALPGGYRIEAIDADQITLSRDGVQLVQYPGK